MELTEGEVVLGEGTLEWKLVEKSPACRAHILNAYRPKEGLVRGDERSRFVHRLHEADAACFACLAEASRIFGRCRLFTVEDGVVVGRQRGREYIC